MAHTYTNLIFDIVFSTQGPLPLIKAEIKKELYAYLGALINEKGGKPIIINGVMDHVDLLILLPPDMSVSDAMKFVKANSSRWMKQRFGKPFAWQKGFGAFSVSRSRPRRVTVHRRSGGPSCKNGFPDRIRVAFEEERGRF